MCWGCVCVCCFCLSWSNSKPGLITWLWRSTSNRDVIIVSKIGIWWWKVQGLITSCVTCNHYSVIWCTPGVDIPGTVALLVMLNLQSKYEGWSSIRFNLEVLSPTSSHFIKVIEWIKVSPGHPGFFKWGKQLNCKGCWLALIEIYPSLH